jgi:hypothetical protein
MGRLKMALVVAALIIAPAAHARAQVQLAMKDGLVTLSAKDATVRQILTEWARIGQTRIVNGERVMGGPISLELIDVPEKQALDIVLRSISGYMAAPRPDPIANASRFDRILVLPAPVQARAAASPPSSPPPAPPPLPQPRVQPYLPDPDADPSGGGGAPGRDGFVVGQRQPVVATTPVPVPIPAPSTNAPALPAPTPVAAPATSPSVPTGTRAPGMIVQPPPPQAPVSPGVQPSR